MKNTVIRAIDELGRIALPQEFRQSLAWGTETKVTIQKEGARLFLERKFTRPVLCAGKAKIFV